MSIITHAGISYCINLNCIVEIAGEKINFDCIACFYSRGGLLPFYKTI